MTTFDYSPLFRTAIGFDRLVRLADSAHSGEATSYPPYNIERTSEDGYRLTLAVAGFGPDDVELTVRESTLVVAGKLAQPPPKAELLHRGIANRAFERRFVLADHIQVEGAELVNGLLLISLRRVVPEALKPRRIELAGSRTQVAPSIANDAGQAAQAA